MADKELLSQELGPEADLSIVLEGDKVVISVKYDGAGGGAEMRGIVKAQYFLDQLKKLIPGQIDDMIIDLASGTFLKP